MMGDMGGMMGPGWMIFGMVVSLLLGLGLLVLVTIGIIAGIRWLLNGSAHSGSGGQSDRALELLRERYARGEVSQEEFRRMQEDLKAGKSPGR